MTHMSEPHILRIQKDIREFYKEYSKQLYAVCEEQDMSRVHALILGPTGTPYERGFFYFTLHYGRDYPTKPPHVKLQTTGARRVRFNPNLYADGKVCLSILNTWEGPQWSPVTTLFTTLLSIQSLINEKPYHNEPGHEEPSTGRAGRGQTMDQRVRDYNNIIAYETIRVAVVGMLSKDSPDAQNMPKALRDVMIASFRDNYGYFESTVRSRLLMDGQPAKDPFKDRNRPPTFQYKQLLKSLQALKVEHRVVDGAPTVPDSQKPSTSSETAPVAAKDDPLVKEYYSMADTMVAKGDPRPRQPAKPEVSDIIALMNDGLEDDSMTLEEYEEDSSVGDAGAGGQQSP